MTDRKKPGVPFWATVIVVVLLLYVASFGPACWISERTATGAGPVSVVYQPMLWFWMSTKQPGTLVRWYALVGTTDGSFAINTVDGSFEITW
jgi:hypothetical protein